MAELTCISSKESDSTALSMQLANMQDEIKKGTAKWDNLLSNTAAGVGADTFPPAPKNQAEDSPHWRPAFFWAEARVFDRANNYAGFWQIPIRKEARHVTSFTAPNGIHYQFCRAPFGLSSSPAACQYALIGLFLGKNRIKHFYLLGRY